MADLYVTSPPMKGDDVLAVQRRLVELGYTVGKIDGTYGPATMGAVKAFQRSLGLTTDGIVGPKTRKALDKAALPDDGDATPAGSVIGGKALEVSLTFLGIHESPANSNKTQFGKWFGVDGVAWCNIFVSYCLWHGSRYLLCDGFDGPGVVPNKGCMYVPTTQAWLQAKGLWIGHADPLPGDIVIYDFGHGPHHIGFVEKLLGNGRLSAIEGNTSSTDDTNGGIVMRRTRTLSRVAGFGRLV